MVGSNQQHETWNQKHWGNVPLSGCGAAKDSLMRRCLGPVALSDACCWIAVRG